jgi:hypothetical protein
MMEYLVLVFLHCLHQFSLGNYLLSAYVKDILLLQAQSDKDGIQLSLRSWKIVLQSISGV